MKSIVWLLLFHVIGSSLYSQQLRWKLSPQGASPAAIARAGFPDKDWVPAVVPGTVFYAYVKAGKEKDPDYGDNIYQVDAKKYNQPFWYRTEFPTMKLKNNQRVWLKFNGINKYADIWFNGKQIAYLHGHMQRGIYDITSMLNHTGNNAIAVLISPPKYDPDHNHGLANWESPTYLSSGSWDWMPAVPGLNSGITDTVALSITGPVSISDPWVRTEMPDTNAASIRVSATLTNSSPVAVSGTFNAVISPGNIVISSNRMTVAAGSSQEISLAPYLLQHPHLWWPNGCGEPFLYNCKLSFDTTSIHQSFGIRKVSADTTSLNGPMRVYINQVPVFLKGGNWGMSDYMLKARGKDYETRIRLHHAMNFNMIRNWTGEVTDNAFYEYCDQYGIMVWDDFWLNNMGGIDSLPMFSDNVTEKLKKFRNHPAIVIWCGANEGVPGGNPSGDLSNTITSAIHTYDGDSRLYLPRSNAGVLNPNFSVHGGSKNLSGSGIWANVDPRTYFTDPHNGYLFSNNSWGMRSELGMATFVNPESFKKFMPAAYWVAPSPDSVKSNTNMWARHFFSTDAALGGGADPVKYINDINRSYGPSATLEDFCKKAQLLNLATMKAMFEGWNDHLWNDASGLLIWMSQSAYPSFIWQTYDYYYDLTGAYFGAMSACEPLHIQWNPASKMVKIINNKNHALNNLIATATVYNADGKPLSFYTKKITLSVNASAVKDVFTMLTDTTALSAIHFLRLKLYDSNGLLLSENTYLNGKNYMDYTTLNNLPAVAVAVSAPVKTSKGITYIVSNPSKQSVAAGVRVQLLDNSGKQILPVFINDSYFTLMQAEKKQVQIDVDVALLKNGYRLDAKAYNH